MWSWFAINFPMSHVQFNGSKLLSKLWKRNSKKSWRTLVRPDVSSTFCCFEIMSGRTNVLIPYQLVKIGKKALLHVFPFKSSYRNGKSFLSLLSRYKGICFGHHSQPVEARKKFLYENWSEFCLQFDAIKNNYEKGNKKVSFLD